MKSKNYYYDALDSQEDYRQYLKKTYGASDSCEIIIKNGYVMRKKEDVKEGDTNETRQQVYSDIEGETLRIYNLIDEANEEIYEQMQLQEVLEEPNEEVLNLELEMIADDLFDNLADSIRNLTQNAYESFLIKLGDSDDGSAESLKPFLGQTLLSEEVYDTINTWVDNLKTWFLDNIDAELNATSLHTQKSFLSEAIENVEEFFSKVKNRVEQLINNILSFVRTEAHKVKFKIQGVEKYEIVASVGDGTCHRCRDMDGQIFDVDELNVPETAPPFHPNCCCVMVPFVEDDVEEDDDEITEYVTASQLSDIGFTNVTDSMVEELNQTLAKYDIVTKEQISHFLAQCYVESGIWRTEIDWSNDNFAHIQGGPDYRGAGAIHISHDYTYQEFFEYIGVDASDIDVAPYVYVDENYYWESAGWYWSMFKDINSKITQDTTVEEITRIVNGGDGGLDDRKEAYERAQEVLE